MGTGARTATPGAVTSTSGPVDEKLAITSAASTAPTAIAPGNFAGYPTVLQQPLLPAAATTRTPAACAAATASDRAWLVWVAPRLMLMTSMPLATAQSMPAATHDRAPDPLAASTFTA